MQRVIGAFVVLISLLAGVPYGQVPQSATGAPGSAVKVAFITSTSRLGDKGFNDGVAAGVQKAAKEFNLKYTIVQSNADTDYVPNLSRAVEEGFTIVMVAGFQMGDAVKEVAKRYPNARFGAVDVEFSDGRIANVREILFAEEQPSYLLGVLTASMLKAKSHPVFQKKNALGVVAGVEQPAVNRFVTGYLCGAKSVDASVPIYVQFTGTWQNPPLFREAAIAEFNRGAGAIFEIGGVAGLSIIEAAKELGYLEMTTDQDKNDLAPNHVLSSAMKDLVQATYLTIRDVVKGQFKGGIERYTLANGGVRIAPFHGLSKYVPASVQQQVDKAKADIVSGKLVVAKTLEAGKACLNSVNFKRPK